VELDTAGQAIGFVLYGDGTEPWRYGSDLAEDAFFVRSEKAFARAYEAAR